MVTLTEAQMPNHTHTSNSFPAPGNRPGPDGNTFGTVIGATPYQTNTSSNLVNMADEALAAAGGSQSHNNLQPFLTMNFIIALVGLYPSRS